jgi:predicted enzyme related to lactoylglutathione lyase
MSASPIIHLNIPSRDLGESAALYGEIFGWEFTPNTDEYWLFGDGGHGGGFTLNTSPSRDGVLLFIQGEGIEATLDKITARGVRTVKAMAPTGGGGFCAVFDDPHGNLLRLATPH